MLTSMSSSVMMVVARHVTSVMRPDCCPSSMSTQSPTSKGLCICSARPDTRLPSVSCNPKPITAVSTADVVRIDAGSTSMDRRATRPTTRYTPAVDTSRKMRGVERAARRSTTTSRRSKTMLRPIEASKKNVERKTRTGPMTKSVGSTRSRPAHRSERTSRTAP
jgi:hypothetical protein